MKKYTKKSLLGRLLIFAATIVWGSSFIILKNTLKDLGNGHFTFFILSCRFIIASVCFALLSCYKFKKINIETVRSGVGLGIILYMAYALQTIGLKYTTASKNGFLTAIYVIIVPFMTWLIAKRHPRLRNYVAAVIGLIGIAFVGLSGKQGKGSNEVLGDILSLLCGIFYALQIFFNPKAVKDKDAILVLLFECITCAALFALTSGVAEFPFHYEEFAISTEVVLKLLYLGVMCTCFAQFAQLVGQKYVSPATTSLILSFEAVFGMIFELIFGQANITVYIIIGFACIFVAILINELGLPSFGRKSEKNK